MSDTKDTKTIPPHPDLWINQDDHKYDGLQSVIVWSSERVLETGQLSSHRDHTGMVDRLFYQSGSRTFQMGENGSEALV